MFSSINVKYILDQLKWIYRFSKLGSPQLLSTFTTHSAEQIALILNENEIQSYLVTGGGAYNDFLIELISQKTNCQLPIPNKQLVEFKEALVFAFMGVLRLRNETNIYSSVTGG